MFFLIGCFVSCLQVYRLLIRHGWEIKKALSEPNAIRYGSADGSAAPVLNEKGGLLSVQVLAPSARRLPLVNPRALPGAPRRLANLAFLPSGLWPRIFPRSLFATRPDRRHSRHSSQYCSHTAAQKLINDFDGFRDKADPDPATGGDPLTIGYGFTRINGLPVVPGQSLSR